MTLPSVLIALAILVGLLVAYGIACVAIWIVYVSRLARGDFGDPTDLTEETP